MRSPLAAQFAMWQEYGAMSESGITVALNDLSPWDVRGILIMRAARIKAMESKSQDAKGKHGR